MKDARLRRAELTVAMAITTIAVLLNLLAAFSAGPLWRDEANTVGLATLPPFKDVWSNLQYDSFPVLWIALIRGFSSAVGDMNDPAFRALGFVLALVLIGAIWANARAFRVSYPLLSLALLALNPSVVRWGSSLRAYGLGMATAVLTCLTIWRYVEKPRPANFVLATLAATASVHTLFYNAPVVLALCIAGVVVLALRRQWRSAAGVLATGGISALSLLVYVPTIRSAASWNPLVQIPNYDFPWFIYKLNQAFHVGTWATILWVFVVLFAASAALIELRRKPSRLPDDARMPVLYGTVALVVGSLAQYAFLTKLSYLTQPWYYLTLIGLTVTCADIILGKLAVPPVARVARIAAAVIIAGVTLPSAIALARTRMTNVDKAALAIEHLAGPKDQVVLDPWYLGVSFDRYYRGTAPWVMLPSVGFSRFHRYDRIMPFMLEADQMAAVHTALEKARTCLRNGGTLYLVSENRFGTATAVPLRRAAMLPEEGWKSPAYQKQWSALLRHELAQHARSIATLELGEQSRVGRYENLKVTTINGWRD